MDFVLMAKWFVVVLYALGILLTPTFIAKDIEGREPLSVGLSVWSRAFGVSVNVFVIWILLTRV